MNEEDYYDFAYSFGGGYDPYANDDDNGDWWMNDSGGGSTAAGYNNYANTGYNNYGNAGYDDFEAAVRASGGNQRSFRDSGGLFDGLQFSEAMQRGNAGRLWAEATGQAAPDEYVTPNAPNNAATWLEAGQRAPTWDEAYADTGAWTQPQPNPDDPDYGRMTSSTPDERGRDASNRRGDMYADSSTPIGRPYNPLWLVNEDPNARRPMPAFDTSPQVFDPNSPLSTFDKQPDAPAWMAAADTPLGAAQRKLWGADSGLMDKIGAGMTIAGEAANRVLGFNPLDWSKSAERTLGRVAQNVSGSWGEKEAAKYGQATGPLTTLADDVQQDSSALAPVMGGATSGYYERSKTERNTTGTANPLQNLFGFKNPAQLLQGAADAVDSSTPEAWALAQVRDMTYSGKDLQRSAAQRILAGEDPRVVREGAQAPSRNAFEDEYELWQKRVNEYAEGQARLAASRGGNADMAREAALREVQAKRMIPGMESVGAELLGNVLLDPLNLLDLAPALPAKLTKAGQAQEAANRASKAAAAADEITAAATGISKSAIGGAWADAPIFKQINSAANDFKKAFIYTPATQAGVMSGSAYKQVSNLTVDASSADEALGLIKQYVNDPQALAGSVGQWVNSVDAEIARPVLKAALPELEKSAASGKWLDAAGEFNPAQFLVDVVPQFETQANAIAKYDPTVKKTGAARVAADAKAWMSEFYLRTMGYVVRNMIGDTAVAVGDGLRMGERMDTVQRDLNKFGVYSQRVSEALAGQAGKAGMLEGQTSKLSNVPVIGAIQNKIGSIAERGERERYLRGYHSALMDGWAQAWQPKVSAELRATMPQIAAAIEARAGEAMSAKDVRKLSEAVIKDSTEAFSVRGLLANATDLSVDTQVKLGEGIRAAMRKGGDAPSAIAESKNLINQMRQQVRDDKATKLVDMGRVIRPQADVVGDWVLDIEEHQRSLKAMLGRQVNKGEINAGQAAEILAQALEPMREQTRQLAEARKGLAQVFGALPDGVTGEQAEHTLNVFNWIVQRELELREPVRLANDADYTKLMRAKASASDWANYRQVSGGRWAAVNGAIVGEYNKANALLKQVLTDPAAAAEAMKAQGVKPLNDVIGAMMQRTEDRVKAAAKLKGAAVAEVASEAQFAELVNSARQVYDTSQLEALRKAKGTVSANPELAADVMGVLWSSKRDADLRWEQVIGKRGQLLSSKQSGAISHEQYSKLMNAEWQEAFNFVNKIYDTYLPTRLWEMEKGRSELAQRLIKLGYPDNQVGRLVKGLSDGSTADEMQTIVRGAVRYKPAVDEAAVAARLAENAKAAAGPSISAIKPPASAAEFMPDADDAARLAEATRYRREAEGLAMGSAQLEATRTAKSSMIDQRDVARLLNPDGSPKRVNGVNWLESRGGGGVDKLATEYGYDDIDQFYAAVQQAQRARQSERTLGGAKAVQQGSDAASTAAAQWANIEAELRRGQQFAEGMSAEAAGARGMVRDIIANGGLDDSEGIRELIKSSTPEIANAMQDELAQMARERALLNAERLADTASDINVVYEGILSPLVSARFGTDDAMRTTQDMLAWARAQGINEIGGMQTERNVDLIRAIAKELGLNPDEFVKNERGLSDLVKLAREKNAGLVDDVIGAAATKQGGKIKAEAWIELQSKHGLLGQRRSAGEIIRELAGPATIPTPPATSGAGKAARGGLADLMGGERLTGAVDVGVPSAEEVARMDAAVARHGNAQAPDLIDMLTATQKRELAALDAVEAALTPEMVEALRNPNQLDRQTRALIERDVQTLIKQFYEARAGVANYAEARADFSLLNYGMRRQADDWISLVAPYSYWATRQGKNYLTRFAEKPQTLVHFLEYKEAERKANEQRGTRKRFEGGIEIPFAGGLIDKATGTQGNRAYLDPLSMVFPFSGFFETNWENGAEAKGTLGTIYEAAANFGLRPGPWVDIPTRYFNLLVTAKEGTPEYEQQMAAIGRGSIGGLIPQTAQIKAATAMLGIGGAAGFDAEQRARAALGYDSAGKWESYGVARAIRDSATEQNAALGDKFNSTPYLVAQGLVAGLDEAQWNWLLNSATSGEIAKRFNLDSHTAAAALTVVRESASRAARQSGVSMLASSMLGLKVTPESQGERIFNQMQQAERAASYNPITGLGSKAELDAVREALPALAVGRAQYGTVAGERETQGFDIYRSQTRAQVNEAFDKLKDQLIKTRPWDRNAANEIEAQRRTALDAVQKAGVDNTQAPPTPEATSAAWVQAYNKAASGAGLAGFATSGGASGGVGGSSEAQPYRPRSVAGANPTEAAAIRREELMAAVAATAPRADQFKDDKGAINWDGYKTATAQWEATIGQRVKQSPTVAAIVQQGEADSAGRGAQLQSLASSITPAMIKNYQRRNDTPLEAAQRVWYEQVYTPQRALRLPPGKTLEMLTAAQRAEVYEERDKRVAAATPTSTKALVQMVQAAYPKRWDTATLTEALAGVAMPSVGVAERALMTEAQRKTADGRVAARETAKQRAEADAFKRETAAKQKAESMRIAEEKKAAAAAKAAAAKAAAAAKRQAAANKAAAAKAERAAEVNRFKTDAANEQKAFTSMVVGHFGQQAYDAYVAWRLAPDTQTKNYYAKAVPAVRTIDTVRQNFAKENEAFRRTYGVAEATPSKYKYTK